MAWPWHLIDLTHQQAEARRTILDRYGRYSQLSPWVPILCYNLYRLGVWVASERRRASVKYSQAPTSPSLKKHRQTQKGVVSAWWRRIVWWLDGESFFDSERKFWLLSVVWTAWLLFLSVYKTGDDYLHFTKRIGHVAIAQLPFHYMLSMKSLYSPLAIAFRTSHEHLNPYHRFLGRIIHYMFLAHGILYFNFFLQKQMFIQKLTQTNVIIGTVALVMLDLVAGTALVQVRRWNYRVFFVTHVVIGIAVLPLLFFHASHLRTYVSECLFIFIWDIIARKLDTVQGYSTVQAIPDTNLVKIGIPVPQSKIRRFQRAPGQHVYLSLPPQSISKEMASPMNDLLFNPFTVASVNSTTSEITLVLRALNGPTTIALSQLTKLPKAYPPINIEGPYGSSRHFPNFAASFDRVLLVAGGVGATFILPIYNHIQETLHQEAMSPSQVHLIWSMRSAAEAQWVERLSASSPTDPEFTAKEEGNLSKNESKPGGSPQEKGSAKSVHEASAKRIQVQNSPLFSVAEDSNVKIFITGLQSHQSGARYDTDPRDGSVELEDLDKTEGPEAVFHRLERGRPDLARIVNGVFGAGTEERVAVLVCGPEGMVKELRASVGKWVCKGRDVWWWDEGFGW